MIFYIVLSLVLVLAALMLARPYLRRVIDSGGRRRRANVLAYQGRLAEIGNEAAADVIRPEAVEELRQEAAEQLLDTEESAATVVAGSRRVAVLPLALVFLAGFAALGYATAGSWRTVELIELSKRDPVAAEQRGIAEMVAGLEQRLQNQPDDTEGWAMLGRSYAALGRHAEAVAAWSKANALSQAAPQPDWLVAEGEARAMVAEPRDLAASRSYFERALAADAQHPRALLYLGLAAAQAGDYEAALEAWLKLRAQELPPEIATLLDQRLPQLAQLAGRELPPPSVADAPGVNTDLQVVLDVSLAAALRSQLTPDMTLFVFARAESGPQMPLAVRRIAAPQLPLQVTLDDSLAMTPALRLSQFQRWTFVARLSRSGSAEAASGDIEGRVVAGRDQVGEPLQLVMDRVLP